MSLGTLDKDALKQIKELQAINKLYEMLETIGKFPIMPRDTYVPPYTRWNIGIDYTKDYRP